MSKNDIKIKAIKLAFLGDSAVGKTTIIETYLDVEFNEDFISTIGWDKKKTKITLENGEEMELTIWDTAGQERYHSVAIKVIKQVQGIIVVFDVTKRETFISVVDWLHVIDDNFIDVSIILFGNKCDLEDKRQVTEEEAIKFAKEKNLTYLETSAKNIKEGISAIANEVYKKYKNVEPTIKLNKKKAGKKKI
jgi:small GTP-binding protein